MRKRSTGFGLPELIIAMGLAAALAAGVAKLLNYANKSGKAVTARADFASLADMVAVAMKDPNTCAANLYNSQTTPDTVSFSPTATITASKQLNEIRIGTNSIAKKNAAFGNLQITQLEMQEADPTKRVVTATQMSTLAKVTLRAQVIGNADKAWDRDYFVNVTTTLVSGSTQHNIISCMLQTATSTTTSSSGGGYTVLVRHSQTASIPACPTGWDSLWTGYSFAGSQWRSLDLGSTGSCLEDFNPLPYIICDDWNMTCDYNNHFEYTMWLTNLTNDELATDGIALNRAKVGRCSVCAKAAPVLVRHNVTNSSAPTCPTGWSSLWAGYSFAGSTTIDAYPDVNHLGSTGSCLEVYKPLPVLECGAWGDVDRCDFWTAFDKGLWLTWYRQPTGNKLNFGNATTNSYVSNCVVCTKD